MTRAILGVVVAVVAACGGSSRTEGGGGSAEAGAGGRGGADAAGRGTGDAGEERFAGGAESAGGKPSDVCVPNETQLCYGPGACRGAQPCRKDGSGWEPCDCGSSATGQGGSAGDDVPSSAGRATGGVPAGGNGQDHSGGRHTGGSAGGDVPGSGGRPCSGACGSTQVCEDGECVCPMGQELCVGVCVDVMTNPANCGRCNNVCPASKACLDGACACDTNAGFTVCAGDCADLRTDPEHCGGCDTPCPEDWVCALGTCEEGCPTEAPLLCGSSCVDPQTDVLHCGDCDTVCDAGWVCDAGACACGGGLTYCEAAAARCIDAQTDNANCGRCGRQCGAGQVCTAGACVCTQGLTACGEQCADLETDPDYCGTCDNYCGETQSCEAGVCSCNDELMTNCPIADGTWECADTTTSRSHCGDCATACKSGELCQASHCVKTDIQVKTNCLGAAQAVRPQLRVCNASTDVVDIGKMTLKYWFDQDEAAGMLVAETDFGPYVASAVVETIPDGPPGADRVVSVTFSASASLKAGGCTDAQVRIHTSTYTNGFDFTNDYSYKEGEWIANELVGLYDSTGERIWGIEPRLVTSGAAGAP
jgi:hypothetical protein